MKIYTTLQLGEFHTHYCEDYLLVAPLSTDRKLIAVLDGCTMATESVFAAMLYGKILKQVAKSLYYEEFVSGDKRNLEDMLRYIIKKLINETRQVKNQLGLEVSELLATLILGVIDTEERKAEILAIGDGLVCVDGSFIEYEQNDKPDYLGYHLSENFENWYSAQEQRLAIANFTELAICTDGIFAIRNLELKKQQLTEKEILNFILVDKEHTIYDNLLDRKIRYLREKYNHVVTDDLAVIRIIMNEE